MRGALLATWMILAAACSSSRKDVDPSVGGAPTGGTVPGDGDGDGEGGAGGGAGADGGGGGGGPAPCLDVGEPCDGGVCMQIVDGGGTRLACVEGDACVVDGPCGADGTCVVVVTADGAFATCADGEPGDPCSGDGDCDSMVCETTVDAGGARSVCL